MFHLQPNRNFRNFLVNGKRPNSSGSALFPFEHMIGRILSREP